MFSLLLFPLSSFDTDLEDPCLPWPFPSPTWWRSPCHQGSPFPQDLPLHNFGRCRAISVRSITSVFAGLLTSRTSNNRVCLCCGFWHRRLGPVRLPIFVSPPAVCAHVRCQVWYNSPMRFLSISLEIKVSGKLRRHGRT